ncbi:MAG: hypothetical protein ACRDQ1_01940, partial [Sciscionella sp.]
MSENAESNTNAEPSVAREARQAPGDAAPRPEVVDRPATAVMEEGTEVAGMSPPRDRTAVVTQPTVGDDGTEVRSAVDQDVEVDAASSAGDPPQRPVVDSQAGPTGAAEQDDTAELNETTELDDTAESDETTERKGSTDRTGQGEDMFLPAIPPGEPCGSAATRGGQPEHTPEQPPGDAQHGPPGHSEISNTKDD